MSSLNGRKVTKLRLHQATHVPGYGQIGTDTTPGVQNGGLLEYALCELGIFVTFTIGKKLAAEALIPFANVVVAVFSESPKP